MRNLVRTVQRFLQYILLRERFNATILLLIARARANGYFDGNDEERIAQNLLEKSDSWRSDEAFVLLLAAWAAAAREAGLYMTYSYSSSSGEGGGGVELDARLVELIGSLRDYADSFLAGTEILANIRRLFTSDNIDAMTTALAKTILGDDFQTVGPQNDDEGGLENLTAAINEAITQKDRSGRHHDHLGRCANWLVVETVPQEERRAVFNGVFGPGMDAVSLPALVRWRPQRRPCSGAS